MASEKKSKKDLTSGMYECEKIIGLYKGDVVVYHSSTAQVLEEKGFIKILKKIKTYIPKTMKQ